MSPPELDERRYADYALNLHDFGIFGLSGTARDTQPPPGNANSPLYPAFIATVMRFDMALAESVRCELRKTIKQSIEQAGNSACPQNYTALLFTQLVLVVISMGLLWLTAQMLFGRYCLSWLAGLLAYATTKPDFYARNMLTEILVLVFFAILLFSLTAALRSDKKHWWGVLGAALACLTLTRPEYLYLSAILLVLGTLTTLIKRQFNDWSRLLIPVCTFIIIAGPWVMRNYVHFDTVSITGGYGEKTIAYRASYNRMSEQEWKAAFVYWLPGYGERLATRFLDPQSYAKLGTDENSYLYKEGVEIFEAGLSAVNGKRERLTSYLIRTEILQNPTAHILASMPLAWRGVLTGKYLAVIGLPSFFLLLYYAFRTRQSVLLILCFPAIFMICFYAGASVSIPRYNIYLIYYYAISIAWLACSGFALVKNKLTLRH